MTTINLTAGGTLDFQVGSNSVTVNAPGSAALVWPLGAPDGSAAAPSYGFSNDGDLGMYRVGSSELGFAAGGALKFSVGDATSDNVESPAKTIRHGAKLEPVTLEVGDDESAALYGKVSPGGNQQLLLYLEVDDTQVDTAGGAIKIAHDGEGDAVFIGALNNGPSLESASFFDGSRGIISTVQWEAKDGNARDFGNTTTFQSVWGDDGTGGSQTAPNFGAFYAALGLGHSFRVRLQDPLATGWAWGRVELAISEYSLARYRWAQYNNGEQHQLSTVATAGSPAEAAPVSKWVGSWWNGGAPQDKEVTLRPAMDGSGNPLVDLETDTVARLRLSADGVSVRGDRVNVQSSHTPSSASDTGTAGDVAWDSTYVYVCVATNTWQRVAHATW